MAKYRVTVKAKESSCPHIKEGDKFVIEENMLVLNECDAVCAVALSSIQYSLYMMQKADDPKMFGRDDVYCLQCPDTDSKVTFEISREKAKN